MASKRTKIGAQTRKTALGALLTALGVVLIYIGAVTDVLDLSMCALASFLCLVALLELKLGFAFSVYTATLLLSLILLPSKLAAFEYAFIALFVILKPIFERLNRLSAWIVKFAYFNLVLVSLYLLMKYVFMLPDENTAVTLGLVVMGNLAFWLFDIALTRVVLVYVFKLRRRLRIDKFFGNWRNLP